MQRHVGQQAEYIKWKRHVKRRDNYKCQWSFCNCKTKLQVHHILEWSKYPHLRYDVNNGITLCKVHHKSIKGHEGLYASIFSNKVMENKKNASNKKPKRRDV